MAKEENFDLVLKPMEEKLTCSFCKKFFKEPTSMICGHVFCKKCIPKNHDASVCIICRATCKSKDLRPAPYVTGIFQAYQETDTLIKSKKNHHLSPTKSVTRECLSRGSNLGMDNFDQNDSSSSRKRGRALCINNSCQKVPKNSNTKGMEKVAQLKFSVQRYEDDCAFCHSFRNMEVVIFQKMDLFYCNNHPQVTSQIRSLELLMFKLCLFLEERNTTFSSLNVTRAWANCSACRMEKWCQNLMSPVKTAQYAHENCLKWAPGVHFENNQVYNLDMVVNSTARQICNKCGLSNATIHCSYKYCSKKYHAPCAYYIDECRWDTENLRMLCPAHASKKLP